MCDLQVFSAFMHMNEPPNIGGKLPSTQDYTFTKITQLLTTKAIDI